MFHKERQEIDVFLDSIESDFKQTINNLTQEEIENSCIDYVSRLHSLRTIIPKYKIDEVFKTTPEIRRSFEEFKSNLMRACELADWQMEVYDFFNRGNRLAFAKLLLPETVSERHIISVIIPLINKNLKFLIDFMDKNGYYLIRNFIGEEPEEYSDSNDPKYVRMANVCFALKQPIDLAPVIKENFEYLYHVTSAANAFIIMRNGLFPKERKSMYDIRNTEIHYPARTYFFFGQTETEAIDYAKNNMPRGVYHLLGIKISNLPSTIKIYSDPLLGGNAVYIEDEIPPELIDDLMLFKI